MSKPLFPLTSAHLRNFQPRRTKPRLEITSSGSSNPTASNRSSKSFYNRLCSCFRRVSYYDLHGFYGTWVAHDELRLGFFQHTLSFSCYGDPAYTSSDAEQAIAADPRRRPLVDQ